MRYKKYFTVKQWKKFKKTKVKGVKHNVDTQELMCKKYDIILTDYKTKRERIIIFLKKINMKNINKGIDTFNKAIQAFGGSMDQLSKEFGSSEKVQPSKDKENLEKLWGKSSTNVKIWSNSDTRESKSRITQDGLQERQDHHADDNKCYDNQANSNAGPSFACSRSSLARC